MADNQPSPEKILQLVNGGWVAGIVGAAAANGLFDHLEQPAAAADVAKKAGLSPRGALALLDGLLGVGLITLAGGRYHNTPEASTFLVRGKPAYLGGLAQLNAQTLSSWERLAEVAKTGAPVEKDTADVAENPFWEQLVPSIAALSVPVAQIAAEKLAIPKAGPITWLDVGGGSGIYSAIWLGLNPKAKGVQLDWANVNGIAKGFVAKFGVADRFSTIDGDLHTVDFGSARYDIAIYSHIAHQETPQDNVAVFRKFRKALKPGATLLISDFILNDDRTGHPFSLIFNANMLLMTKGGATYRQADYRAWLAEAGFKTVSIEPTPLPATLIYAR